MTQYCTDCALYKNNNNECPIFHDNMTDKEGCPYFAQELNPCDLCGGHIFGAFTLIEDDGQWHRMCQACNTKFGTCDTCARFICRFRTDNSIRIPPTIMIQKRQGNMVMQMPQVNPERVKVTCQAGCPCWQEEEDGGFCKFEICKNCENYQAKWNR